MHYIRCVLYITCLRALYSSSSNIITLRKCQQGNRPEHHHRHQHRQHHHLQPRFHRLLFIAFFIGTITASTKTSALQCSLRASASPCRASGFTPTIHIFKNPIRSCWHSHPLHLHLSIVDLPTIVTDRRQQCYGLECTSPHECLVRCSLSVK